MFTGDDERAIAEAEAWRDRIPLPDEADQGGELYERWLDRWAGDAA